MSKEFSSNATDCNIAPKERQEILKALEYLKVLDDDWNGFGANRVYELAITTAEQFIMSLPFNKKYPQAVSPDGEGGLTLKWSLDQVQQDKKLILTFEPGLIHMAYKPVVGEPIYEDDIVYFAGDTYIPQKIITRIPNNQEFIQILELKKEIFDLKILNSHLKKKVSYLSMISNSIFGHLK